MAGSGFASEGQSGGRGARHVESRLEDARQGHEVTAPDPGGERTGITDDERHVDQGLMNRECMSQQSAVIPEVFAVVTDDDHHRRVEDLEVP